MKARFTVLVIFLIALVAAAARAEHAGGGVDSSGRAIADPNSNAKLYNMINACLIGRPGAASLGLGAIAGGGAAAAATGGGGAALFQARCTACHAAKDAQASIACIQGRCKAAGMPQMPPTGPLSAEESAAIVKFLQTGA